MSTPDHGFAALRWRDVVERGYDDGREVVRDGLLVQITDQVRKPSMYEYTDRYATAVCFCGSEFEGGSGSEDGALRLLKTHIKSVTPRRGIFGRRNRGGGRG